MLSGVWGRKIGMTQVFSENDTIIPVTVIDLDNWYVTNIKKQDKYNAVQVGCVRKKYADQPFSTEWIKQPKAYFAMIKEVKVLGDSEISFQIGQKIDGAALLEGTEYVNVVGITKGRGFQGAVKRHGFSGGPASHGPRFGRWPGSMSFMRSQGKVIKGKRLPGHMGVDQCMMKNLKVVRVESGAKIALIKGSVPGNSGSLVFMQKA
jgi:large subunit ribosomal protein L3